jgi:riboflavin synthase
VFTGIVEELGSVERILEGNAGITALDIACTGVVADARVGDSISVNGCCLTVTSFLHDGDGARRGFRTELMGETLDRTALGALLPGSQVNLEPALRADGRLGGHLVQGHVDAIAEVRAVEPQGAWTVMTFALPAAIAPYVVEKGSITVQGTSLTVMDVAADTFSVGLIPHTLEVTVLGALRPGDPVNLEADVVAKYVERMLRGGVATPYTPRGGSDAAADDAPGGPEGRPHPGGTS